MKLIFKKISWVALFVFAWGMANGQDSIIPDQPEEFHDFLILQGDVPGLSYRFLTTDLILPEELLGDSLYLFAKMDSGWVSKEFSNFGSLSEFETKLDNAHLHFNSQYLVYSEPATLASTREYLGNLIRGGDFVVKLELPTPTEDIVALASSSPYSPLEKIKLRFVSDLKLFIVTLIIILFFVVASTMIVAMLVLKARKNNRENLRKEYDQLIIDPLTSLLFEKELEEIIDLDQSTLNDYFPDLLLSKTLFKDILIERIIGLNKKMKGDFKEKLKALYKKLNLDKQSLAALKSKNWDQVAMGLVQINEMDLTEAAPQVMVHTNSSNFQIRSQAVATLLNLTPDVDLTFLRDQTFPLSLWQQMNYLRIIRFVNHQKKIKVEVLFDSKNPSIRIFGYKLMKILGRVDLIAAVSKLAPSVSDEEKIEILEIYGALGAHMEVDFVNECLRSENPELVTAASRAAGAIGDQESAEILLDLINSDIGFRGKMTHAKSLNELNKDYFEKAMKESSNLELLEIKNHISDPLLLNV